MHQLDRLRIYCFALLFITGRLYHGFLAETVILTSTMGLIVIDFDKKSGRSVQSVQDLKALPKTIDKIPKIAENYRILRI